MARCNEMQWGCNGAMWCGAMGGAMGTVPIAFADQTHSVRPTAAIAQKRQSLLV